MQCTVRRDVHWWATDRLQGRGPKFAAVYCSGCVSIFVGALAGFLLLLCLFVSRMCTIHIAACREAFITVLEDDCKDQFRDCLLIYFGGSFRKNSAALIPPCGTHEHNLFCGVWKVIHHCVAGCLKELASLFAPRASFSFFRTLRLFDALSAIVKRFGDSTASQELLGALMQSDHTIKVFVLTLTRPCSCQWHDRYLLA